MDDYLNETLIIETNGKQFPVGTKKEYLFLDKQEIAKILYTRLNRESISINHLSINECTKFANIIQQDLKRSYLNGQEDLNSIGERYVPMSYGIIDKTTMTKFDKERFYCEMAQIYPKYCKDKNIKKPYGVWVRQGQEGPVPHVHIYFGKEDNPKTPVAYICLHDAVYAWWHKDGKLLNTHEQDELEVFFNTFQEKTFTADIDGKPIPCNCWRKAVDIYEETHKTHGHLYKRDKNGRLIQPDYRNLSVKAS